jgi:hypothetical protein
MAHRPKPPPGQKPPLVWTGRDPRRLALLFLGLLALSAALFSLADGGLSWLSSPRLPLGLTALSALAALLAWVRAPSMAAGPDWLRYGPLWVKTSRLRRLRLASGARPVLFLEDTAGRTLELDVTRLAAHHALNDLLLSTLRRTAAGLDLDPRTREFLNG